MKKIVSLALCACFVCMFIKADAKIRRVGYSGPQITNVDYVSLQAAHDASIAGDTLYIFPGSWSADFNRKLVVIGYGYFNNVTKDSTHANPGLQNIVGNLNIYAKLNTGDSSEFLGINGLTIHLSFACTKLLIKRCIINFKSENGSTQNYKGVQIIQSYITYFGYAIPTGSYFSNLLIENSYISNFDLNPSQNALNAGILSNNIIASANFKNGQFVITNNIFLGNHSNDASCTYTYNIANSTYQIPNSGNNKNNKNYSTTSLNSDFFVGYLPQGNTSDDGRWQLKAGSPAKNAGEDGEDCGMFGGADPYKLSGIPPIPAFYKLTAPSPSASSNPYTITFSVRANN